MSHAPALLISNRFNGPSYDRTIVDEPHYYLVASLVDRNISRFKGTSLIGLTAGLTALLSAGLTALLSA
ncbi:MAG: hypothetical protein ACTSUE_21030, partial [Promethearchaeota archaeon]